MASKEATRRVQQGTRKHIITKLHEAEVIMARHGKGGKNDERVLRTKHKGRVIVLISKGANELQPGLMEGAHMQGDEHQGTVATLQRLQEYCCWFRLETQVKKFVKVFLH